MASLGLVGIRPGELAQRVPIRARTPDPLTSHTTMHSHQDRTKQKLLCIVSHGAGLLSFSIVSIAIPIVILLLSEDYIVQENAKEAVNFQLTFFIYGIIVGILCFVLIGFLALIPLIILNVILPILAIVGCAANPDRPFRYPFVLHLL